MDQGTPQGGSMSSALFNLGQSRSIREASRLHPHVTIMLIADDTHVLGHPKEVIAVIKTTRTLYSRIGLTLAAKMYYLAWRYSCWSPQLRDGICEQMC